MIAFEGFELKNSEDNIINKQLSTQPMILDQAMKLFGAKEGSSWSEDVSFLNADQRLGLSESLSGLKDLKYKGPGSYESGQAADELEGFRDSSVSSLRKLQDEGRLSVAGIEKLRNMMATASGQVAPDVSAIRDIGDKAWAGYDAQLAETTRGAREKMQQADIASRRGQGARGGTALQRLGSQNVMEYGRTVGGAAARAVEQSAIQRQQLALQARMGAGQLGLGVAGLGLQGLQAAGQLELGELGLTAQDLAQRRGLASQEKMFGAGHALNVAKFSEEQAQAKNLWAQRNSEFENTFGLDRLSRLGDLSSRRTQERIEHVKKGSAGMLPGLVGAAMTIWGGPAGAAAAPMVAGAMSAKYTGGSGARRQQAGPMEAMMMAKGLSSMSDGTGTGTQPDLNDMAIYDQGNLNQPTADPSYAWYQDDPNSGWFDTGSYKDWFGGGGGGSIPDAFSTSANINTPTRGFGAPGIPRTGRVNPASYQEYSGDPRVNMAPAQNDDYWGGKWNRLKNQYNTTTWNPTAWDPDGTARNPDGSPVQHLFSWW